jgi:pyruvate dehydrogenase E2 component (dihydrolipoamide acetyltransferase)
MAELIQMPKLSDTMTTGTLVRWLKQEGDSVFSGDMLAEVETDKATMEVENFVEGILLKRYVQEGVVVPIGAAICAIGQKGENLPVVSDISVNSDQTSSQANVSLSKLLTSTSLPIPTINQDQSKSLENLQEDRNSKSPPQQISNRLKASPLARKIADVLNAQQKTATFGIKTEFCSYANSDFNLSKGYTIQQQQDIPISNIRSIIAQRLLESKTQIPHFYLEIEVNADPLLQMREAINHRLKNASENQEIFKFTVNDFILKASADALRRVPQINASWKGTHITQHAEVHLSFGVAVEDGLVTPVIRDAHMKGLREISLEAKELILKARDKKLKPSEMNGSTFTVTNLGMYGVRTFFGIINSPNAAILSVGTTLKKPVIDTHNNITIGHSMTLGFSGDHRVIDGAIGAEFLSALKEILENPALMLL